MQTFFAVARNNIANNVKGHVTLHYPTKTGTLQQQLDMIKNMGKPVPQELNGIQVPILVVLNSFEEYILAHWNAIGRSRVWNDGDAGPITDTMIKHYKEVMEEELRVVDLQLIKYVDSEYISELSTQYALNNKE